MKASFEASDRGARTAFLLDSDGFVAEGPGFNVLVIKDGVLHTPHRNALPGITRKTVLELRSRGGPGGSCGPAWSAAVSRGAPDGPITAMKACGDRAAVAYAQQLNGTNVWVGMVLVFAAGLLAVFMMVSGWAVLKVSVKAIWTTVILLPALWLGAIPGAPQRRTTEVVW